MTSSATSTDRRPPGGEATFQAWHFFVLLSMVGATAAVIMARDTHPAALLLLSAAVIAAGFVAVAIHRAAAGFFSRGIEAPALKVHAREDLEREKALVLRSIKELEFDRAMKKISEADYSAISTRLRARAMALMQELERAPVTQPAAPPVARTEAPRVQADRAGAVCPACGTGNDADARFCKQCGGKLDAA